MRQFLMTLADHHAISMFSWHRLQLMKSRAAARISKGGQISLPANVRRRWQTDRVWIEDRGDAVIVTPLPADPIGAARGSLRLPKGLTSDKLREIARAEEEQVEAPRTGTS